uniref:Uncharacterized protein n=1 Tax=Arundo donax TaxID=35708 RepID=A0A0A9E408_ARUDO
MGYTYHGVIMPILQICCKDLWKVHGNNNRCDA